MAEKVNNVNTWGRKGASGFHNPVWGPFEARRWLSRSKRSEFICPCTNDKTEPHPQKTGKPYPGSHKEWILAGGGGRGGAGCPDPIRLSHLRDSLRDSRPGLGRRRLHPARVRQEGPSGKEGTTPTPAAATPGLSRRAGGAGRRLAPASLGRLPAPPRGGRQMGRPPAQLRRQETAAGAARDAAAGAGGGARAGAAPGGRGQAAQPWCRSACAIPESPAPPPIAGFP